MSIDNLILVSCRVTENKSFPETRDAIDQKWIAFLITAGLCPVLLPNHDDVLQQYLRNFQFKGVLLTGGNDLASVGGNALVRDKIEAQLLKYCISQSLPLIGVCRGMQIIQHYFGVRLEAISGHVSPHQTVQYLGEKINVNSYHNFGTRESHPELQVTGRSEDHIVKAVRHLSAPVSGIMWHPERMDIFRQQDLELFRETFLK